MVARFAGACLGLLAFGVCAVAGLLVQNPVAVTLSRSVLALFVFCLIGFILGSAAQMIVTEHAARRESETCKRYDESSTEGADAGDRDAPDGGAAQELTQGTGRSMAT